MSTPIDAILDHVAVAVPDWDAADVRWRDQLGGRWVTPGGDNGRFRTRQLRFAGGGKLELIAPPVRTDAVGDGFVERFLARFGSAVHHVTLKVPELGEAIVRLEASGFEVIDVQLDKPHWREAFLRPKQVGGVVVQVAWASMSDLEFAAAMGHAPEDPPADAARLLGPLLRHPDPAGATRVWSLLGADVQRSGDAVVCRWPRSPLELVVERGEPAGPVALRFAGAPALPAVDGLGPAVVPVRPV